MESVHSSEAIRPAVNLLRIYVWYRAIAAGLDKFSNLLTNWEQYLDAGIAGMLPVGPHTFMMIAGVIEIIAGIIVLFKPAVGELIVAARLTAIALTLLAAGNFLDMAVKDLVMAISAFSPARISRYTL